MKQYETDQLLATLQCSLLRFYNKSVPLNHSYDHYQELMSSRRLRRSVQLSISGCKSALNITADQTGPYTRLRLRFLQVGLQGD